MKLAKISFSRKIFPTELVQQYGVETIRFGSQPIGNSLMSYLLVLGPEENREEFYRRCYDYLGKSSFKELIKICGDEEADIVQLLTHRTGNYISSLELLRKNNLTHLFTCVRPCKQVSHDGSETILNEHMFVLTPSEAKTNEFLSEIKRYYRIEEEKKTYLSPWDLLLELFTLNSSEYKIFRELVKDGRFKNEMELITHALGTYRRVRKALALA